MKFSIVAILLLLAMQSNLAMKKLSIKDTSTHRFQFKIAKPDAEWREKLAKAQQTEEWKILEKNRALTEELFQSDILAKQSSQIRSTFNYIKNLFNKADSSAQLRAMLKEKSDLQNVLDEELKKQNENIKMALDIAEMGDAEVHHRVLTKLHECLKENNALQKQTIFQMEQEIASYLNNEKVHNCIHHPRAIELALKAISSSAITAETSWNYLEQACKECTALIALRQANETTISNLTACHNHLDQCFDNKLINAFKQVLTNRIKGHKELNYEFTHLNIVLRELIAAKETAIIDYYKKWIKQINLAYIKIQNWTTVELEKAQQHKQIIEKHLNLLVPCPLISDKIKNKAQLLNTFNNSLIDLIQKKLSLVPLNVTQKPEPTEDPDNEPIPKGYFPLCSIEADVHTKDTIIDALEKWKHYSSLTLDPTNTILYPEERARAHSFHFVSNGNACISLAMIKQKKNSKKPFRITDGIQFIDEDKKTQWIRFETVGPDKVYHSPHLNKFYLYSPAMDTQNAYLVESILAECTLEQTASTNESSGQSPNPTTDEK